MTKNNNRTVWSSDQGLRLAAYAGRSQSLEKSSLFPLINKQFIFTAIRKGAAGNLLRY